MPDGPISVPAADVARDFQRYRAEAHRHPVAVTQDGQTDVVILSAEEYARLKRRDRQALRVEELTDEELEAIANAQPTPESALYDHECE